MEKSASGNLWAVVLAAGQGTRMAPVTRLLCGRQLPKQYVALVSERTLLQETLDRIATLIPPERTVVVVSDAYEDLAREQLEEYEGVEIVAQPADLGTGPGVLLPLAHVMARDPRGSVAIFPSDHHIRRREPFLEAIEQGLFAAARSPSGVALVGAEADRPATDLGWIVPVEQVGSMGARVKRFVEKPAEPMARLLMTAGGLWNTMVMTGSVSAFWNLCLTHMPIQTQRFGRYVARLAGPTGRAELEKMYRELQPADFSRDVMQGAEGLAVVSLATAAGWFDCGTPERLVEWLYKTSDRAGILRRLGPAFARPASVVGGEAAVA
jgi:mannose-1-phosphate guanylyltransferase